MPKKPKPPIPIEQIDLREISNESPECTMRKSEIMKTKEIIKTARELAKPFRITKGKNFRLKDVDPDDTLEFTKQADSREQKKRWHWA